MNDRKSLTELSAFTAVVTHRSFRKAAEALALSPSALSHIMRSLETRMGVRLLHRTTRSVAPTEAGQRLFQRLDPLLRDIDAALSEIEEFRGEPSGTLRINATETSARPLLEKVVPAFVSRYPEMAIDLVCDGRLVDIVAQGFDAGIRLRESVPQDMVAIPFGGPARFVVIGASEYLSACPAPRNPADLMRHRCIRHRMPSGRLYRWEFERRGEEIVVDVPGSVTLDSIPMMVHAARQGLGLAYVPLMAAEEGLAQGRLVTVLDEWCPRIDGLCLYYPGHRHVPAGLRAFIEMLRQWQ